MIVLWLLSSQICKYISVILFQCTNVSPTILYGLGIWRYKLTIFYFIVVLGNSWHLQYLTVVMQSFLLILLFHSRLCRFLVQIISNSECQTGQGHIYLCLVIVTFLMVSFILPHNVLHLYGLLLRLSLLLLWLVNVFMFQFSKFSIYLSILLSIILM